MIKKVFLTLCTFTFLFSFQSSLEDRLYSLNRQLMCPICDGLTLEQSQANVAVEMREEIKKMVIKGMSDQDIKDFYV
jgi:cytochrome c-type biogenesis protein CcmH